MSGEVVHQVMRATRKADSHNYLSMQRVSCTGVPSGSSRSTEEWSPTQQGRHSWRRGSGILSREGGRPDSNPDSTRWCCFPVPQFPPLYMGVIALLGTGRIAEETALGRATAERVSHRGWLGLLLMNEGWTSL